ncbi:MAG: caspase family protein, partial [Planctomycetaceae bacterium]|nr:caspase family protein [Planctomycetaceae bacterium]
MSAAIRWTVRVGIVLVVVAGLACGRLPADEPRPRNFALLVGVTRYEREQMNATALSFPETDATALAAVLTGSGYDVETLLGAAAKQQGVRTALAGFASRGTAGGVVVIGLFGHGVQYGDDAYFAPYDTTLRRVVDSQGIPLR